MMNDLSLKKIHFYFYIIFHSYDSTMSHLIRNVWRMTYSMTYDVHDVLDLDRSGAGPISSPIHKKINFIFFNFYFFEISKWLLVWAYPGESKNALRVVGGAWGAELRTITSREIWTRSTSFIFYVSFISINFNFIRYCMHTVTVI